LIAPDAEAMRALGARAARAALALEQPVVIAIEGELGAGKTTFVGGFLGALGFTGYARSPTYTLIEPYDLAGRAVFHLDLYRLNDPLEVEALGLRDLLQPLTILLIEWPERGVGMLPAADLAIQIRYSSAGRELVLNGHSAAGIAIEHGALDATKP